LQRLKAVMLMPVSATVAKKKKRKQKKRNQDDSFESC
jgi:hypothetical protein